MRGLMPHVELERKISSFGALAIAVNGVIGSGIFILPALAASVAGSFSPWLFVILGLVMLPIGISLGRMARLTTETGGPAVYVKETFGPRWGALAAWIGFSAGVTGMAAATDIFTSYLGVFFPTLSEGWGRISVILVVWAALGIINMIGIQKSSKLINGITLVKTIPLITLVIGVLIIFRSQLFVVAASPPQLLLPTSSVLPILYAFIGFEGVLVLAGETRNPQKTIPRAIAICLLTCTVFYFLVQTACVLSSPDLANSKQPLIQVANALLGVVGSPLIAMLACISVVGTLAAGALTQPRYLFSLGTQFPTLKAVSKIHPRFHTPWIAILITVSLNAGLACGSHFLHLARWVVLAKFVLYSASIVSLLKVKGAREIYGVPGVALAACAIVATQVNAFEWETLLGIAAFGIILIFPNWGARTLKKTWASDEF